MNYSEHIIECLRQREGLDKDDASLDSELVELSKNKVFSEVLRWNGLLGNWDYAIKEWIKNIYGIDLDEIE